jgi:hypothetical protein
LLAIQKKRSDRQQGIAATKAAAEAAKKAREAEKARIKAAALALKKGGGRGHA